MGFLELETGRRGDDWSVEWDTSVPSASGGVQFEGVAELGGSP